jgi:hypothetical protein
MPKGQRAYIRKEDLVKMGKANTADYKLTTARKRTWSETGYFDFAKICSLCKSVCQQVSKHKKQQKLEILRTQLKFG